MKLLHKPSDPIIADRWADVASGFLWLIYAAWGVAAYYAGLATIASQSPGWYESIWSISIAVLSTIASASAFSLFWQIPRLTPVRKKTIELGSVFALGFFIAVYPILLTTAAWDGDQNRIASAILAYSYLVFPVLRIHMLRQRIKSFELAQKEIQAHGII